MTEDRFRELVKVAFDIAISSLDFASGFLDHEEVTALRDLAEELGADPWDATPYNMRASFCPGHEWEVRQSPFGGAYEICGVCKARPYQVYESEGRSGG